jgi:hypothetical protein
MVAQAVLDEHLRALGECERDKIVDIIQQSLLFGWPAFERRTN